MRLINARTLKLEEFFDNIPPYAILSHTWGHEEVTFHEMSTLDSRSKAGYEKIIKTCQLALNRNITYAWIDTCCIDKKSSAELTESINSMYEFYTRAQVCFVYLADLPAHIHFNEGIGKCRWITRGWTLQEMIASAIIDFYDKEWIFRGTKEKFCDQLSRCTGVPRSILNKTKSVAWYSVAQRMSWASGRKTTRVEDRAYCLFGIFQVNMPLIYGERHMAFRRLQEEIIKRTNDTTIFAWNPDPEEDSSSFCSIFAPSPENFGDGKMIEPWSRTSHDPEYTLTNKGLQMQDYLYILDFTMSDVKSGQKSRERNYVLALGTYDLDSGKQQAIGVQLRKIGPDLFSRRNRNLVLLDQERRSKCAVTPESPFHIMADIVEPAFDDLRRFRKRAIRFNGFGAHFIPHGLWDSMDRCFLDSSLSLVRGFLIKINLRGKVEELGVLIEWRPDDNSYDFLLFNTVAFEKQKRALFFGQLNRDTKLRLRWREFEEQFPEMKSLPNKLRINGLHSVFIITATASLGLEEVQGLGRMVEMFCFGLRVREETAKGELIEEMDGMKLLC